MQQPYLKRIADRQLADKLQSSGAVLIEGPKWCGKTRTAKEHAKSVLEMQNPDKAETYLQIAKIKPSELLQGDNPRLLDEWQVAPQIWDAVRYEVDKRSEFGQFILTGSATPNDNQTMHSGVGRIARLKMYPMSLYESGESTGEISLGELFTNPDQDISAHAKLDLDGLIYAIHRGGWPEVIAKPNNPRALSIATEYIEQVIESDISRIDGVRKNTDRVRSLLKSYARNISTLANDTTLYNDIAANNSSLSIVSISQYLEALSRIFVIKDIPAWMPHLRSKTGIRTSSKRQFIDPSLATAIMRLSPSRFFQEINYYGFLFESLCERDLRIYIESIDGDLFHYRDADGLEVDAILQLRNGAWAGVEIKLGVDEFEEAANNLLKLKEKVNEKNPPAFLMILSGTQDIAYRRKDGIYVVPIGCLKP